MHKEIKISVEQYVEAPKLITKFTNIFRGKDNKTNIVTLGKPRTLVTILDLTNDKEMVIDDIHIGILKMLNENIIFFNGNNLIKINKSYVQAINGRWVKNKSKEIEPGATVFMEIGHELYFGPGYKNVMKILDKHK